MKLLLPFFCIASLVACAPAATETVEDTPPAAARDLCFLQVTSSAQTINGTDTIHGMTDSLAVRLHIDGDRVSGELSWLPGEKDRMTGTLQGTMQGGRIVALYSYSAEGMTAKEQKIMRIDAQGLRIKSGELEAHEGVWTLKDTAAAVFSEAVPSVPCR